MEMESTHKIMFLFKKPIMCKQLYVFSPSLEVAWQAGALYKLCKPFFEGITSVRCRVSPPGQQKPNNSKKPNGSQGHKTHPTPEVLWAETTADSNLILELKVTRETSVSDRADST